MMKKKIITMLLATVLVLFLVVVPSTVAAAGEYTIRLADTSGNSTVSAYAGDTVKVVLSIANNPGITGVGVKVNYPAGVSLAAQPKDVSGFSSVASVNRVFSQNTTDDPYVMWWNMALGDSSKKLVVKEGNLAELTFKIADNATPGDYKITLTAPADMNRTANVDGNKKIIDNSIVSINNIVPVDCIIRVKPAPVKITKQPANSTAAEGKTVSTTVKATGDGLTYTWYYKNASASSYAKSSVKSATYSTKMSTAVNGRKVYCVIKDQYGNTVTSNTVTLKGTPVKIATQPVSVTVAKGATAKVTVKATGDGLTYKWYYKDKGASKFTLTKSFTGNTYSVAMNASRSGRQLYCKVTDKYGNTVTTKTVTISMKVAITKQPVSVTVANGKTAKVTVSAAGEGLTYKWYYKNKGATKFSLTTSFTGASYSLKMDASRSGRQVYCKVTDKFGNTVTTKTVTLSMEATITKQPVSVTVANGKTAKVTVSAAGEGLTYKWYYKNKGATKFSLSSVKTSTYATTMKSAVSGRQVYCKVTDKFGNTVTTKTVTLSMEATITKQPVSVTVANGKTAKVTVSAAGEGLTYKWYYKNKGATKFSLTTSFTGASYSLKMDASRSGRQVYCKVTDKFGNTVKTNTVTLKMK